MYSLTMTSLMISIVFPVFARVLLTAFRGRVRSTFPAWAIPAEGTSAPVRAPIDLDSGQTPSPYTTRRTGPAREVPCSEFGTTLARSACQAPFLAPKRELGDGRFAV